MWDSFFEEFDHITGDQMMWNHSRAFFEKHAFEVPQWAGPVAKNFGMAAIPGAVASYKTAPEDKKKRKALKGAVVGGAVGVAGGHIAELAKRDIGAYRDALRMHGLDNVRNSAPHVKEKVWDTIAKLKQYRPLYKKSSAKKEESIVALATGAGVGEKLLKTAELAVDVDAVVQSYLSMREESHELD